LAFGCLLAAHAIGAQQAAIEQRPRPGAGARENGALNVKSTSALVLDQAGQRVLYSKNIDWVVPIASITKLMTALIVLESGCPRRAHQDHQHTATAEGHALASHRRHVHSRDDLLRSR
jgi:D-alanyl-D-alanine endopeptidase (penicillin-binding protein 7)